MKLDWLKLLLFRTKPTKKSISHMDIVAALRDSGMEITDRAVREAEMGLGEMLATMKKRRIPRPEHPGDFVLRLLNSLGAGIYDPDTGAWMPTSADVYSFDAEAVDIEHMYALFLQGIAAIIPDAQFTEVTETIREREHPDMPAEEMKPGELPLEGYKSVAFTLNGHRYERELEYHGDWFDETAIGWINEILAREGFPGRLHFFYDGGQGLILLYGDEAFGERLMKIIPERYHGRK